MLTAISVDKNKYHCIDSVFLTVANHFKREIGLMSVGSWGFDYQPNLVGARTFGEKLQSGMVLPSREAVQRYHGIRVDWQENVTWGELKSVINTHIKEKRPLGIYINGYNCPWNPVYHQVKVDHYCIVVGYDAKKKIYYCVDSYFSQGLKVYSLPEADLKDGFREYISFRLETPVSSYSLRQIFQDVQLGENDFFIRKTSFENIERFGRDLSQELDIDLEMKNCKGEIETARLYRQFIQYSQRRQNFADALIFLRSNAYDVTTQMAVNLEFVIDEFNKISKMWKNMAMLMIKLLLTKKDIVLEKMGDVMEQIAKNELKLLENTIDIGRMKT